MGLAMQFLKIKSVPTLFWSSPKPLTIKPPLLSVLMLMGGLLIFGLGEALLVASSAGVSPWTVFAQGLTNITSFFIGFSTFIISSFILLLWRPLRQTPGIGTILNIIIISLIIELSISHLPVFTSPIMQIGEATLGVIFTGIGGEIYKIST